MFDRCRTCVAAGHLEQQQPSEPTNLHDDDDAAEPDLCALSDVLPFGDTGEDIVNEGMELGPDCIVVLEMLDKGGNVLATSSFGGPAHVDGIGKP